MSYYVDFIGAFRVEPEFSMEHTKTLQKFFENDHRSEIAVFFLFFH